MNRVVLTGRFCQTLAHFITCYLTPATLCLSEAIKQVSEATKAPCDTNKCPPLFCTCISSGKWSEVMLLRLHDTVFAHGHAFHLLHAHTHSPFLVYCLLCLVLLVWFCVGA